MPKKIQYKDNESGQTLIEYVLVVVLIVLVLISAFQLANIGDAVKIQGDKIQNHLTDTE